MFCCLVILLFIFGQSLVVEKWQLRHSNEKALAATAELSFIPGASAWSSILHQSLKRKSFIISALWSKSPESRLLILWSFSCALDLYGSSLSKRCDACNGQQSGKLKLVYNTCYIDCRFTTEKMPFRMKTVFIFDLEKCIESGKSSRNIKILSKEIISIVRSINPIEHNARQLNINWMPLSGLSCDKKNRPQKNCENVQFDELIKVFVGRTHLLRSPKCRSIRKMT